MVLCCRRMAAITLALLLSWKDCWFADAAADGGDDASFAGWTCDALTPNLCDDLVEETGVVPMRGGVPVRYWKYSLPGSTTTTTRLTPIIVLHGGPAWPHEYLLPLKQLACREPGREIIFYDQAGCGESIVPESNVTTTIAEDYPWLLTIEYYALEELPKLIEHLKIDTYHILGNSWGTILAQVFALDGHKTAPAIRNGLLSLTLSGCISDIPLYIQQQWDPVDGSLGRLPDYMQARIRAMTQKQAYDSAEYEAVDAVLTTYFTIRTAPFPDCFEQSLSKLNVEIYVGMQGASEFTIAGVLADFNVTGRLRAALATMPVLLTTGIFDTVRPIVAETMHQQLPLSERVLFRRSGHLTMIDEAGKMNDLVADFVTRVEQAWQHNAPFVPQTRENDDYKESPVLEHGESATHPPALINAGAENGPTVLFLGGVLTGVLLVWAVSQFGRLHRRRLLYQEIGAGQHS